jgi:hypothetical protein
MRPDDPARRSRRVSGFIANHLRFQIKFFDAGLTAH